jgi:polar amino acid transport system substrate-binding protein
MKKLVFIAALALTLALLLGGPAPAGTVLDRILKTGDLVVATTGTQPPLSITAKGGEIIGLDADIAKLIASSLGVKVRFSKMLFTELIPALESGKADMIISGMTMTPERNAKVPFIGPYFVSGKGILCKEKSLAALDKEGLDSTKFKVAALKGSTSQIFVETFKVVIVISQGIHLRQGRFRDAHLHLHGGFGLWDRLPCLCHLLLNGGGLGWR